jgi:hypothetical protein
MKNIAADDIVAELDAWLQGKLPRGHSLDVMPTLEHARDEILALREIATPREVDRAEGSDIFLRNAFDQGRADALEEAARECERLGPLGYTAAQCGSAIRALKG